MKKVLTWSLPVRLLHFALAASVTAALVLGLAYDDDDPLFVFHAWFGLVAAGALVLRVLLGFIGPADARFSRWNWSLRALADFAVGAATGKKEERHATHNPAASWVMAGILGATGLAVATGLQGGEDLHEVAAYGLLGLIGAHLAGLAFHTFRHREVIALSMLHGRKVAPAGEELPHASAGVGVVVALLLAVWVAVLVQGFDRKSGTVKLPFVSAPVSLGENEHGKGKHQGGRDDDD